MKKKISINILILFFSLNLQAQQEEKAVLAGEYSLKLNSSVLGALLKPKDVIKIELPKNTKSWFYVFTAKLNDNNTNIFKAISSTIVSATIESSNMYTLGGSSLLMPIISSKLSIPTGEAAVSIYCLNEPNASSFLNGRNFTPHPFGRVEKMKEGKIEVAATTNGNVYLGIQNKSSFQRVVYVSLQVYAITEESKPQSAYTTNGWSIENKRIMFNRWMNEALKSGFNQNQARDVARCTQMSILSKYSFDDYKRMGIEKWNKAVTQLFKPCSTF